MGRNWQGVYPAGHPVDRRRRPGDQGARHCGLVHGGESWTRSLYSVFAITFGVCLSLIALRIIARILRGAKVQSIAAAPGGQAAQV